MDEVSYIRLECVDINGITRGMILDSDYYKKNSENGIGLYGGMTSTLTFSGEIILKDGGDDEADYRNSFMYPDIVTFRQLPWKPYVGCVLADFRLSSNNRNSDLSPVSPRNICKNQIQKLSCLGMQLYGAFEYEFYTISEDFSPSAKKCNYSSTQASLWAEDLAMDIMQNLKRMYIFPETYNGEYGLSQQEITMQPGFGINCPDNATRYKQTVQEISKKHNFRATFMSKPFLDQSGSSGHFNHSLWSIDGKNNLFYDPQRLDKISKIAEYWIAGLRHHSNALMALFCPTTNCYERIKPDSLIPINNAWGIDNRTVAYRVKNLDSSQTYVENRISGAAANQYLVVAGCIIAGLDGINKKMKLETRACKGNAEKSKDPKNISLPRRLQDSLSELLSSDLFKIELGEEFLNAFEVLKKDEIKRMQNAKNNENLEEWYREFYNFCV